MSNITSLEKLQNETIADVTPVNDNFEALRIAVNDNDGRIASLRTETSFNFSEINSNLATTKQELLTEIDTIKEDLKEANNLPHIIKVSDKSLLPSFYIIYSNGLCLQGGSGKTDSAGNARVNLSYKYLSTNQFNALVAPTQWIFADSNVSVSAKNVSYIDIYGMTWTNATTGRGTAITFDWQTLGYIDLSEV